jgi:hypothetical protein
MGPHTSVPRHGIPAAPDRAREYLALSFGLEGQAAVDAWLARTEPSVPRRRLAAAAADEAALAALATELDGAVVGLRVLLGGPQADVYAARAAAVGLGLIDEEPVLLVTSEAAKRVHCPHCKGLTMTEQPVGATVPCRRCRRQLVIHHHFSRRTASYLGFMADAEEPALPQEATA